MPATPPFYGDWPVDQGGTVGPPGPPGPPGATGATGATGAQGPAGANGAPGTDGTDGRTVLTTIGPPSNAVGLDGDYAFDPLATIMYGPRAAGAWPGGGIQLTGPPGTSGNTVRTTSGAPAPAFGVNGDFAYDPVATIMYGPKSGGVWGLGTFLTGPAGPTGTTGAPGATGATGTPGSTGAAGTNGNTVLSTTGAPSNAIGAPGDYAIDLNPSSLMYGPKSGGVWPAGFSLRGLNGNTVMTTTGAPLAASGNNGDYAYDPIAQSMYGPKSGGAWPAATSLKGTPGNDGRSVLTTTGLPSGATGSNGDYAYDPVATRMYGPKSAGAWSGPGTLLSGPQGVQGVKGDIGVTGATGPTVAIGGLAVQRSGFDGCDVSPGAVFDETGTFLIVVTSTIHGSMTVVGAGGRGNGAAELPNTWYYVWLWADSNTGFLPTITFDASPTAPTTSNLLPNYNRRILIGAMRNDSGSNFLSQGQFDVSGSWRRVTWDLSVSAQLVLSGGTATSATSVDLSALVPKMACSVLLLMYCTGNGAGDYAMVRIGGHAGNPGFRAYAGDSVVGTADGSQVMLVPFFGDTTSAILYLVTTAGMSCSIAVLGYEYFVG